MGIGLLAWAIGGAAGCASGGSAIADEPRAVPDDGAARRRALERAGRRFYEALAAGRPRALLFDDVELRTLLRPKAATRMAVRRLAMGKELEFRQGAFAMFREADYAGVCVQGARVEPAGTVVGLRERGWVFDRALVVGELPAGDRVASWIEGRFLYTDKGFGALDLRRVETPRWQHTDLGIAPCDMEVGVRSPLGVGEATP